MLVLINPLDTGDFDDNFCTVILSFMIRTQYEKIVLQNSLVINYEASASELLK